MIAALVLARLRRRPGRPLLPGPGLPSRSRSPRCRRRGDDRRRPRRPARARRRDTRPRLRARDPRRPVGRRARASWLGPVTRTVLFESLRLAAARPARRDRAAVRWSRGASTPACAAGAARCLPPPAARDRTAGFRRPAPGRARPAHLGRPARLPPLSPATYARDPAAAAPPDGDGVGLAPLPGLASFYRTTTGSPARRRPAAQLDVGGIDARSSTTRPTLDLDPGLTLEAPFAALEPPGPAPPPRRTGCCWPAAAPRRC